MDVARANDLRDVADPAGAYGDCVDGDRSKLALQLVGLSAEVVRAGDVHHCLKRDHLGRREAGLARDDISRRLEVSVGQGQQRFRQVQIARRATNNTKSPAKTPVWFTKMDRNHDGDLSQREFIGSEEDFRKLDADGDGLISAEEARQFEARTKKEQKR